jgi:transposase
MLSLQLQKFPTPNFEEKCENPPTFQRAFFNRECASSNPPAAERNLVERFFNTIKQYRGIATHYEKTARNFLAGLNLVCALAWLK